MSKNRDFGNKIDQRKYNSAATIEKKIAAGRAGKGSGATTRKYKSVRDPGLPARIEMVVAMAEANGTLVSGKDMVYYSARLMVNHRVRGSKIG